MKIKSLLAACMACFALQALAEPVAFTGARIDTEAVAVAGSDAAVQFGTSPPAALPLITSAVAVGTTEFAAAGGIGSVGLLSTQAEADGGAGFASAVGTSRFVADFLGTGQLFGFSFDLFFTDALQGDAFSSSTLFVQIFSDGIAVVDEVITANGLFEFSHVFAAGALGRIDVLLSSDASGNAGAYGQSVASVAFTASVPEPGTLALIGLPLVWLLCRSRRALAARAVHGGMAWAASAQRSRR